jgi:hypothetical protein
MPSWWSWLIFRMAWLIKKSGEYSSTRDLQASMSKPRSYVASNGGSKFRCGSIARFDLSRASSV